MMSVRLGGTSLEHIAVAIATTSLFAGYLVLFVNPFVEFCGDAVSLGFQFFGGCLIEHIGLQPHFDLRSASVMGVISEVFIVDDARHRAAHVGDLDG